MYIPKQWLVPIGLGFLMAIAAVWLVGQNQALQARVDALEARQDDATATRTVEYRPVAQTSYGLTQEEISELCAFTTSEGAEAGEASGGEGSGSAQSTIEVTKEQGNYATNSGSVLDSFFLDGGQGDVGINIYKSVLTGVNFSTSHQGGSNSSMTESGNADAAEVHGNTPTNTNTPNYTDVSVSTPLDINASMASDDYVIDGSATQSATSSSAGYQASPSFVSETASTQATTAAPDSGDSGPEEASGGGGGTEPGESAGKASEEPGEEPADVPGAVPEAS